MHPHRHACIKDCHISVHACMNMIILCSKHSCVPTVYIHIVHTAQSCTQEYCACVYSKNRSAENICPQCMCCENVHFSTQDMLEPAPAVHCDGQAANNLTYASRWQGDQIKISGHAVKACNKQISFLINCQSKRLAGTRQRRH